MNLHLILPIFLGLSVVTQGVLNRKIAGDWGLSSAIFLNAVVLLVISLVFISGAKWMPQIFPEFLRLQNLEMENAKWWFLIPGLCGFFIVLGVPWSLQNNGPSKTFILLIVSQVVFSLLFEKFVFESSVSILKIVGACVAVLGAILVALN